MPVVICKGVNPYLDTSKKMSGIFSIATMIETTKAKETYWVLAVPEVATSACSTTPKHSGVPRPDQAPRVQGFSLHMITVTERECMQLSDG